MAVEMAYDFDAALSEALETYSDIPEREMAERVVDEMPPPYARSLVVEAVIERIAARRRRSFSRRAAGAPPRSKFDDAAEVAWEVSLLRETIVVNGHRRQFGDLNMGECVLLAKQRKAMADGALRSSKQFAACAGVMKARGLTKVSEIPAADLKKIFHV